MTIRIHRDLTVQTVLDTWPSTCEVFIARRMACVGCDMAPFMTIAEAAAAYGISVDDLESDLRAAAMKTALSP
jgi:hybrid cluster-associated redox disulfide protein